MIASINFENSIIILFAVTMFYVAISSRMEAYIKMLAAQGALLFAVSMHSISPSDYITFSFIIFETLVLKTIVIPLYLMKLIRRNEIQREAKPSIPNLYSLMIVSAITAVGFLFAYWLTGTRQPVNPLFFGGAISVILAALFIIMTRKKLITHIIAFIFLENGIFLLSLSVAQEMPFIVNLGVMLDIFAWVLLAGIFVKMIQTSFTGQNIDSLKGLRD
jgi:hydrogenase-4 component E